MRSGDSRIEYARRMHRVVEYIDRHLDEPLALATLADVAHFSPFHFHRLFAAWMGETLGDYTRRRRIEVAATRLAAQPRVPVIQVALSVGFGSPEAFAHAFKDRFGVSATAWRKSLVERRRDRHATHGQDRNQDQVDRNPDQDGRASNRDDRGSAFIEEPVMQVRLIDREPVRVVYLRYTGPYDRPLAEFWGGRVMPWIASRGLDGRAMVGISHDDPDVTAPEQCRCDVGVEVADDFVAIGDEQTTVIPGGRYASAPFFGTVDRIHETWQGLLRDWLPASGLQLDARPMFEYYSADMRHDDATGAFECQVTVPVMPL